MRGYNFLGQLYDYSYAVVSSTTLCRSNKVLERTHTVNLHNMALQHCGHVASTSSPAAPCLTQLWAGRAQQAFRESPKCLIRRPAKVHPKIPRGYYKSTGCFSSSTVDVMLCAGHAAAGHIGQRAKARFRRDRRVQKLVARASGELAHWTAAEQSLEQGLCSIQGTSIILLWLCR